MMCVTASEQYSVVESLANDAVAYQNTSMQPGAQVLPLGVLYITWRVLCSCAASAEMPPHTCMVVRKFREAAVLFQSLANVADA